MLADKTIVASALALATTAIGWIIAQFYSLWRDDRAKRIQFSIEHAERQLTEFYVPLISLLGKLEETAKIKDEILSRSLGGEDYLRFEEFIYYEYFYKQHTSIQEVLSQKIHLLEGWQIPESYNEYLKHFTSENIHHNLLFKKGEKFEVAIHPFPEDFVSDLKAGQDIVLRRYEASLAEQRDAIKWVWKRNQQITSREFGGDSRVSSSKLLSDSP